MTRTLSKTLAAAAAALALTLGGAAHAQGYEFTFTGADVTGDLVFTTSGSAVTGITGWITDSDVAAGTFNVTGLSGWAGAENTFTTTSPYFSFGGLSFATTTGGQFNLYNQGGSVGLLSEVVTPSGNPAYGYTAIETSSVTAVPEPASIGMLLAAVGMFGVMSSRRRAR